MESSLNKENLMPAVFSINHLTFSYDGKENIFDDLKLDISQGKITTLLGGNGCGKTTLFNLMTKNLKVQKNQILFQGQDVSAMRLKEFATQVAIVHQKNTAPSDISVKKLVSYGRIPYKSLYPKSKSSSDEDEKMITWALEVTDTLKLKDRTVGELSGGQMQRVWIAMALAQGTDVLFLDEPTTFLDVRYQLQVLKLVKRLNCEYGKTIIMVLHDINQALYYSDEIITLAKGQVCAQGRPLEIVNKELLKDVYDVSLDVRNYGSECFVLPI